MGTKDKRVVSLDEFEHNLLINGMNEFRNQLLQDDRPTEDIDELLLKLIDAKTRRELRRDTDREL